MDNQHCVCHFTGGTSTIVVPLGHHKIALDKVKGSPLVTLASGGTTHFLSVPLPACFISAASCVEVVAPCGPDGSKVT